MLTLSETVDEKGTIWFLAAGAVRAGGRKGGLTEFVLARLLVSEINTEQRERVGAAELSNEYVTTLLHTYCFINHSNVKLLSIYN